MSLDARKQDVGPIDPPEPKLTENEVEREVESRLESLFYTRAPFVMKFCLERTNHPDCLDLLLRYQWSGGGYEIDDLAEKLLREFVDYAKNHPDFDFIRREVEES